MADRPTVVTYKWTKRDQLVAQGDVKAGKYVTPYRIWPQCVDDARARADGAMVPLALAKSGEPWAVNRFFPGDKSFSWEKIPSSIPTSGTIADVCAALFAHNPHKYVAAYYDFSKMSESARNNAALLLFDHWENTEYRFAVVSSSGFSWSLLKKDAPLLPAEKDGKRLLYALTKRPVIIPVSAAPGKQVVRPADPGLELISADIYAISSRAKRIKQLLVQSEEVMKRRVLMAADITALKSLFQASATSKSGSTVEASILAAKAAALEPLIKEAMLKKPIAELLPKDKNGLLTGELEKAIREQFGYCEDIGAEVRKLSDELRDMLLHDKSVADRCASWGRYALANNLQTTPAFVSKCNRLVAATTAALDMLAETQSGRALSDRLWKIIEARPARPARTGGDIGVGLDTGLGAIFSIVGSGSRSASTFVGNLAGPPSLSIAAIQAAAAAAFVEVAGQAAKGDPSGLNRMIEKIFDALEGTIDPDIDLYKKLRAARAARDEAALFDLRHEVANAVGGKHQTSLGWRSGLTLLQVLHLAMAIVPFIQKIRAHSKDSTVKGPSLYDYLDVASQGAPTLAGVTETLLQAFDRLEDAKDAIKKLGLAVGRLSAILGLVSGFLDIYASNKAGDDRSFRQVTATTAILGNFFLLMGMLPFVASVPFLQYAGLALLAANILVTTAMQIKDSSAPVNPLGTNIVANAVVQSMTMNPFYDLLLKDPSMGARLKELAEGARRGTLPYAENTALVIDMLRHAGFTKKERAMIVNTDAAPPMLSIEKLLFQGL